MFTPHNGMPNRSFKYGSSNRHVHSSIVPVLRPDVKDALAITMLNLISRLSKQQCEGQRDVKLQFKIQKINGYSTFTCVPEMQSFSSSIIRLHTLIETGLVEQVCTPQHLACPKGHHKGTLDAFDHMNL